MDAVLADPRVTEAGSTLHPDIVLATVRRALSAAREGRIAPGQVVATVLDELPTDGSTLRPVINATGVALHTNLGRARLGPGAIAALRTAAGAVDVEFDTGTGARAARGRGTLQALLSRVPEAEQALLVNNGAAALVLAATALAAGREIVVSRGELVEIGDGFRIPELVSSTGARLREVGTTNRTHLADYRQAIGPATGFVLKVHPSNFAVRGFTSSVPVRELAGLGVPVVADIGSGLLRPDPVLPDEPDAAGWLRAGASIVTASGDKLLGGPQAGLVLGQADTVQTLRRHPLARALRVDKLTLAALEATLTAPSTPTTQVLHADPDQLRVRVDALAAQLGRAGVPTHVVPSDGSVGGGGAPGVTLPGWALALPESYAGRLRRGTPCVVGRVRDRRCLLDLRCVPAEQDSLLLRAVLDVTG